MEFFRKSVLRADQLYKYRKPSDKTVPQRGGEKDFEPDDSWFQSKHLEKFYEERKQVLSEQRVERCGGVVTGEWNSSKQLVELHKEMGKFWVHMGFIDNKRKWLYPEEALFLMETNTMEVWYKGIPISIQQAYSLYFKASFTIEDYIVYAHLRRLGFVVLRSQGRLPFTKYERKIGLDKHVSLKQRKRKLKPDKRGCTKVEFSEDTIQVEGSLCKKSRVTSESEKLIDKFSSEISAQKDASSEEKEIMWKCLDPSMIVTEGRLEHSAGCQIQDSETYNVSDHLHGQKYQCTEAIGADFEKQSLDLSDVNSVASDSAKGGISSDKLTTSKTDIYPAVKHSSWNFGEIIFPDIGLKKRVCLTRPAQIFLPKGVEILQKVVYFDVTQYNLKTKKSRMKQGNIGNGSYDSNSDFEFSYSALIRKQHKIVARNWSEYKQKLSEWEANQSSIQTVNPAEHYWKDEVTPLVRPEDARNTAAVLKKLQVIPSVTDTKGDRFERGIQDMCKPEVSFDVFKPDSKFRKSSPGVPDHRVCVTRSTDDPPDLATLTLLDNFYRDDVPLHWAVVEEGDVAFFSFNNILIPQQIFMG